MIPTASEPVSVDIAISIPCIFTTRDIMKRLRCSHNYARWLAHALRRKGWLYPMVPGTYQLIGADRGRRAFPRQIPT